LLPLVPLLYPPPFLVIILSYANVAFSNEPYGEAFKETLVGDSYKYGITMNAFALNSDTNKGIAMGQVIADSEVNVWVIVFNLMTPALFTNMTMPIKRNVHFIFSETMTNDIVNSFDADSKAVLTGSVVIKAQGYRPGYAPADALKEKVIESCLSLLLQSHRNLILIMTCGRKKKR
jgi:hypothetical protein